MGLLGGTSWGPSDKEVHLNQYSWMELRLHLPLLLPQPNTDPSALSFIPQLCIALSQFHRFSTPS
jgi:hypothetical protein